MTEARRSLGTTSRTCTAIMADYLIGVELLGNCSTELKRSAYGRR
jgi:hypothetical protein